MRNAKEFDKDFVYKEKLKTKSQESFIELSGKYL